VQFTIYSRPDIVESLGFFQGKDGYLLRRTHNTQPSLERLPTGAISSQRIGSTGLSGQLMVSNSMQRAAMQHTAMQHSLFDPGLTSSAGPPD